MGDAGDCQAGGGEGLGMASFGLRPFGGKGDVSNENDFGDRGALGGAVQQDCTLRPEAHG